MAISQRYQTNRNTLMASEKLKPNYKYKRQKKKILTYKRMGLTLYEAIFDFTKQ